jgi:hypothetical protein
MRSRPATKARTAATAAHAIPAIAPVESAECFTGPVEFVADEDGEVFALVVLTIAPAAVDRAVDLEPVTVVDVWGGSADVNVDAFAKSLAGAAMLTTLALLTSQSLAYEARCEMN